MPARMIVVLALAMTATACDRLWPSSPSVAVPAKGQLSAVASSVEHEFDKATAAVMRTLGLAPAASNAANAGPATTKAAAPRATKRARHKTRLAPAATPAPELVPPMMPVAAASTTQPSEVLAIEPVPADESIYTAADVDVSRPSPHASQVPWQWPGGASRTEMLEVVVSQRGEVEQIKLLSPPRRMVDVMALSAAKMWTFEPALKDGAPVRYRLLLTPGAAAFRP